MLKIFKINFFILIFSSGVAMAKDIEVFGVKTLESVFEYVDSLSTAEPHSETLGRKYDQIWITPPKLNSVLLIMLWSMIGIQKLYKGYLVLVKCLISTTVLDRWIHGYPD